MRQDLFDEQLAQVVERVLKLIEVEAPSRLELTPAAPERAHLDLAMKFHELCTHGLLGAEEMVKLSNSLDALCEPGVIELERLSVPRADGVELMNDTPPRVLAPLQLLVIVRSDPCAM